jgi:hypothetical protein
VIGYGDHAIRLNFLEKNSKVKNIEYAASNGVDDMEFTNKQTG